MNNNKEVFKNIEGSYNEHKKEIQKFKKDDKHAIMLITSIQGSGKTTANVDVFADSDDAIILTQSNEKLQEIVDLINERHPGIDYHVIRGLEYSCISYLNDDNLKDRVKQYRKLGILSNDIHKLICNDDNCLYSNQNKTMEGRTIQTFDRFLAQTIMGRMFHNLHSNRLILMDEADGLFDTIKIEPVVSIAMSKYETEIVENVSPYLPEIYKIKIPNKELSVILKRYKELVMNHRTIINNEAEIKQITGLIRVLTEQYFTVEKNKIFTINNDKISKFFLLTNIILKHKMKLVIGTATLRNNRIKFNEVKYFYKLALFLQLENIFEKISKANLDDKNVGFEKEEFLKNLDPEIFEFEASYIPGIMKVYRFTSSKHGYSHSHYKTAFGDRGKDEDRSKIWKELNAEIKQALKLYEKQENVDIKTMKILLITFSEVKNEIEKHKKKMKKNRNRDIFTKMDILPFFSNKMHGINANNNYDLMIVIGDPLDWTTAKFTTKMKTFEILKTGFNVKDDSMEKEVTIKSQISELLEVFHRSRAEIPVIHIGNFLKQSESKQIIINEILQKNNIIMIDINEQIQINTKNKGKNNKIKHTRMGTFIDKSENILELK